MISSLERLDPASPAIIVAAAGISGPLWKEQIAALEWLERDCDPPLIVTPAALKGQPFENFPNNDLDANSRFAKERLWHVEIAFSQPCVGPLILGDGRFSGLGIMMPVL